MCFDSERSLQRRNVDEMLESKEKRKEKRERERERQWKKAATRMRKLFFMFIATPFTAVVLCVSRMELEETYFCLQFPNGQRVYVGL